MVNNDHLPQGWRWVRLGDVCERPEYGASASARPFDPDLPRYVRITDITDDGRLKADGARSADPEQVHGYELGEGDLLFARSGSVGRTYLHRPQNGPCVFAGYLIRFRPDPTVALPRYVECYTHSGTYRRWVASMLRVGAQPNINAAEYSSLPVLLPSITDQRAIVSVLDSIDEAIDHTEAVIAANETAQGTLLAALLARGVPGWHSERTSSPEIGDIPADWKLIRLGDVAGLRKTQTMPMEDDPRPYVALEHIVASGTLNGYAKADESISNKTVFHQGDTLYGKLRPNLRKVVRVDFDGVCSTDILAIYGKAGTCPLFLSHLLRSDLLHEHAMRGIAGTKMPRTSWNHLQMFEFGRPSLPEQRAIAAVLDSGAMATEQVRVELATLRSLKESVAEKLLTGHTRVALTC